MPPIETFISVMHQKNLQLTALGESTLIEEEVVGGRLYTVPLFRDACAHGAYAHAVPCQHAPLRDADVDADVGGRAGPRALARAQRACTQDLARMRRALRMRTRVGSGPRMRERVCACAQQLTQHASNLARASEGTSKPPADEGG